MRNHFIEYWRKFLSTFALLLLVSVPIFIYILGIIKDIPSISIILTLMVAVAIYKGVIDVPNGLGELKRKPLKLFIISLPIIICLAIPIWIIISDIKFEKSIDEMSIKGDIVSMVNRLKDTTLKTNERRYIIKSLGAALLNHHEPKDKQDLALRELCRLMSDDKVKFEATYTVNEVNKKYIIFPEEERIKKLIENPSAVSSTFYRPKGNLIRLFNGHFIDPNKIFWGKTPAEVESIIGNANGVIWIEEKEEQVGVYYKKDEIFGKGPEITTASQLIWFIKVFDVQTHTVTAQTSLVGDMPPGETTIYETHRKYETISGESPQQRLEKWLQELPIRDNR